MSRGGNRDVNRTWQVFVDKIVHFLVCFNYFNFLFLTNKDIQCVPAEEIFNYLIWEVLFNVSYTRPDAVLRRALFLACPPQTPVLHVRLQHLLRALPLSHEKEAVKTRRGVPTSLVSSSLILRRHSARKSSPNLLASVPFRQHSTQVAGNVLRSL